MRKRRGEIGIWFERGHLQRHFGSDQSVWRDGDWNGFVRIALAGLLAKLPRAGWVDGCVSYLIHM